MKINAATLKYIREHAQDDVRQLALRPVPANVDLRAALTQIEGRQLATHKLPTWAATDGLLFPPRLALEQCSSEATSAYKRLLMERLLSNLSNNSPFPVPYPVREGRPSADKSISSPIPNRGGDEEGAVLFDLTGGLGVDFAAIAPLFARAIYVEQQEQLCDLARHNFPLLGLPQAEVRCASAEATLQSFQTQKHSGSQSSFFRSAQQDASHSKNLHFIFIDPARRDAMGRKVARIIEDCTPDICAMQEQLRAAADYVLIKLSPMLDLTAALHAVHRIAEAHVVSLNGECKELLLLMKGNGSNTSERLENHENILTPDTCPIHCIDLPSPNITAGFPSQSSITQSPQQDISLFHSALCDTSNLKSSHFSYFTFTRAEEATAPLLLANNLSTYLYEPNASILKAGAFKTVCQRFPVHKLASQTHLYTSPQLIAGFPGRIWRITDQASFAKLDLRRLLANVTAADLTVRGFPASVATLRHQLRLREGGQTHLIATTLGQQRLLLKVERTH